MEIINRSKSNDNSFRGIWTFYENIDPVKHEILLIHIGIEDA